MSGGGSMNLAGKVVIVTGGGGGLGEAIADRFAAEGARVGVADIDAVAAGSVAARIDGLAVTCDVTSETGIIDAVAEVQDAFGPIDVFCSNTGLNGAPDVFAPDAEWYRQWDAHVMAHVWAARAVLPSMLERGGGNLLNVVSGGALSIQASLAGYSASKRASLALAEWLAINYGPKGIGVTAYCPMGMRTSMLLSSAGKGVGAEVALQRAVEPSVAADAAVDGMKAGRFLVMCQQYPLEEHRHKAQDYDGWIDARQHDRNTPTVPLD